MEKGSKCNKKETLYQMFTVCFIWRKDEQKVSKDIIHYFVLIEEIKIKVGSINIFWAFGMNRPGIEPRSRTPLINTGLIRLMAYLQTFYFQDENHTEVVN